MNSSNQDSTLGRNSKMKNHHPLTSSGEPAPKKRKTAAATADEDENELEKMKAEMAKMKQLVKEQQKTICSQAMTITRLQGEKENCDASDSDDDVTVIRIDDDRPAQSLNGDKIEINMDDEHERNELEKELAELKSKMNSQVLVLQQQSNAKDEKIKQLESMLSTIKNAKTDPEQLQDRLPSADEAVQRLKDLEAQLVFMTCTENSLKKRIVQLKDDRNELTKLLYQNDSDTLKAMILERNKKIAEMEKLLELKEEDLKDLESRMAELNSFYKDAEQQKMNSKDVEYNQLIVEHERAMEKMKAELQSKAENERQSCKAETDALMVTVAELNKKLSIREALLIQYGNQFKESKTAELEIENERQKCKAESDKLKATVTDLNKKLSDKEALIIQYENEFIKLQESKAALQMEVENEKQKSKTEIDVLKASIAVLNEMFSNKQALVSQRDDEMEEMKAAIQNEKNNFKVEIDKLKATVDGLTKKLSKEQVLVTQYENKISQKRAAMQDERNKYKAEINMLKDTVTNLNKKLSKEQACVTQYENKIKEMKTAKSKVEIDNLKDTVDGLNIKLSSKRALITQYENEIKELKTAMQSIVEKERQKGKAENDLLKAIVDNLNKKLSHERALVTQCENAIKEMKATMKSELQNERRKYEEKIRVLDGTVNHLNKKVSDEVAFAVQYMKDMEELKAGMQAEAENEKQNCKVVCDKLKATVDDLTNKISHNQKILDQQLFENEKLKEKVTVFEINEANLRSKIEELEQNEHEANETIAEQQRKIQDLEGGLTKCGGGLKKDGLKFISLDKICNDLTAANNCLTSESNNIILKVSRISSKNGNLEVFSTEGKQLIDFKLLNFFTNTSYQFQINGELEINSDLFYVIMPRIYSCNLTKLNLDGAVISCEIFAKLVLSHTIVSFKDVKVKDEDDKRLGYDEILKELSSIEIFEMEESDGLIISELCKNLSQLPSLPSLQQFKLSPVDPLFDLVNFGEFVKKNPNTEFHLQYPPLSKPQETLLARKERIMRKNLPSNCKVFISF